MNTQKVFKIVRYIVMNGVLVASVYGGFYMGNEGLANIAKFLIWALFGISLVIFVPGLIAKLAREDAPIQRSVPKIVDIMFDVALTMVLVYHGDILYGTVYAIHSTLGQMMFELVENERTKIIMDTLKNT